MADITTTEQYGEQYFKHNCGAIPYERNAEWLGHFSRVADMLAQTINPATLLDAGCAMGILIEALRDRGIEAYGLDISVYAIGQVREDIKPFCRVGSLLEPLPRRYDLITCIEVLEHLPKAEGLQALDRLCNATEDIVFSSSPDDYTESTHFNVQPPEYWAAEFANRGFLRDVDFDGHLISPWAVRFKKENVSLGQTVRGYERKLWPLSKQVGALRQSLVHLSMQSDQHVLELEQKRLQYTVAEQRLLQYVLELEQKRLQYTVAEQRLLQLEHELAQMRNEVVERDARIVEISDEAHVSQARLQNEMLAQQQQHQENDQQRHQEMKQQKLAIQQLHQEVSELRENRQRLIDRLSSIENRRSWQFLERAWQAQMRVAPPTSYQGRAWLALTRLTRRSVNSSSLNNHEIPELPLLETDDDDDPYPEAATTTRAHTYNSYESWAARCEQLRYNPTRVNSEIATFEYRPTISIIMPTYNSPIEYLCAAIDSVVAQYYPDWELCICDDASPDAHVRDILSLYASRDKRIRIIFAEKNSGIGGASNQAIALASGEYLGLLDHDDLLTPDALFEVVSSLQEVRADFIYSDEDKLEINGRRCDPFLKPGWSPDLLLTCMYTSHFSVYRTSIVRSIGGFRLEVNGSQDYDLALRFTEQAANVTHIPKILYHWRKIPGSAAASIEAKPYAYLAAQRALIDALERRRIKGGVEIANAPGYYHVRRTFTTTPKVSILIPTRDRLKLLEQCIRSIEEQTEYQNYEIIIIDNSSQETATAAYLARTPHRVIRDEGAFNYSRLNNRGASEAAGEYLLLLNNDTEVLTPSWISAMLEQAQRPEVGAVGAKLLYPDGLIQHAGVILGLGGVASHAQRYVDGYTGTGYFNYANSLKNYSAVTGACLMVRKELFDQIGGLNEQDLPINFNDVDLCLRLREHDLLVIYTPYALLRHHESATREPVVDEPGRQYMLNRWGEQLFSDPYYHPQFDLTAVDFTINVAKPDSLHTLYIQRLQEGTSEQLNDEQTIGQRFHMTDNNLAAIGLQFATFGRECRGKVTLHLRESVSARNDIVRVTLDASDILDNHHYLFAFAPIHDSAGKSFYFFVELESQTGTKNSLVIWKSAVTDAIFGPYFHNHLPQRGTLSFAIYTYQHLNRHAQIHTPLETGA